jgi:pimeloyl-ACP methyl ester carboxylesterase
MKASVFAGLALALSPLTPAFCASSAFDAGALRVEQISTRGPAVLLIPGLASGTWTWEGTAPRLAATHAVYLMTLPGFDGRPARAGTTLESLRKDLRDLIVTRHIDRPVLVGHSLGGTLALSFAAEDSALIAGVVAVDGLPVFPGTEGVGGDRRALGDRARGQLAGQSPEQFAAYQQTYMKQFGAIDEKLAGELATRSSRSDVGAVADLAAQLLEQDLRPALPRIEVPVVEISPFYAPDFVAMAVDEERKTGYYRILLNGVKQVDVVSISPARHFVMFDQPEKFAAALDAALAKLQPVAVTVDSSKSH